jgi:hypothetical protein
MPVSTAIQGRVAWCDRSFKFGEAGKSSSDRLKTKNAARSLDPRGLIDRFFKFRC